MLPQSEHDRQKAALMEATVKAVAEDGMENLSTREISRRCGVKEVYIYRYFENKDDMVAKTFAESDERFLKLVLNNLPVMKNEAIEYEARCRYLFTKCWEYMMANSERVMFYIQYYYSAAFQRYSYYDHMKRFDVLIEKMRLSVRRTLMLIRCCIICLILCSVRQRNKFYIRRMKSMRKTIPFIYCSA